MAAEPAAKLTLLHIMYEIMGGMYTTDAVLEGEEHVTDLYIYSLAPIFLSGKDSEQFIQLPSCVCSVCRELQVKKSKTCF